jgi:hypothetical protein
MNQLDLQALLTGRFGEARLSNRGWIRIPCPTCQARDAKKMKRYISTQYLSSHCFICGVKLTLSELLGSDDAFPIENYERPTQIAQKEKHPWADKIPCSRAIPINQLPHDHPAIKFLHKDHLYNLDRYASYGAIFCPSDAGVILSSFPFVSSAERLIFPVYFRGNLVGWQMRSLPGTVFGDQEKVIKYYHLFNKGEYLYNYDIAKKFEAVVLTEGVKKAWKFENGVASLGKGLTPMQIQLLQQWKRVTIFLDAEAKTQEFARQVTAAINASPNSVAVNVDPQSFGFPSPDEMTEDQALLAVADAWGVKINDEI